MLRVDNLESYFSFPFKPSEYGTQTVGHLEIRLQIASRFPMTDLNLRSKSYPFSFIENSPQFKSATFEASGIQLGEDLAFSYGLSVPRTAFEFLAYRAPERITANELRDPRLAERDPDGYFEAGVVFNESGRQPGDAEPPPSRSILVMLDTSLSMQWEKLDRAYEATETLLRSLQPQDTFNVMLFNDDVAAFSDKAVDARADQIDRALGFIKSSYLSGGTDMGAALERAAKLAKDMPSKKERAIVMITDGNTTLATSRTGALVERFKKANAAGAGARLYVFGIGSDTNLRLLEELARASRGFFDWTRETTIIGIQAERVHKQGGPPADRFAKARKRRRRELLSHLSRLRSDRLRRDAPFIRRPLQAARPGGADRFGKCRRPSRATHATGRVTRKRRFAPSRAADVGARARGRAAASDRAHGRDDARR